MGRLHRWFAARTDRGSAGFASIGLVGVLAVLASAVVLGNGATSALLRLTSGSAWLGNSDKGGVSLVDGNSHKISGATTIKDARGHLLEIIQDGTSVLIYDRTSGQVSRLDPAQLTATKSISFTKNGQVLLQDKVGYLVDSQAGGITQFDPATLATVGQPVSLPAPLGQAALAADQTLYVPSIPGGDVVPVHDAKPGAPVHAGQPGEDLKVTLAAGKPVVVNATAGTVSRLRDGKLADTVRLPAHGHFLVAQSSPTDVVALTDPSSQSLVVVDLATSTSSTVPLQVAGHELGPPQVHGDKVYVPDQTGGQLVVYDQRAHQLEAPVPVGTGPGLQVLEKDGMLFANQSSGPGAVVIDGRGDVSSLSKYADDVAGVSPVVKALPRPAKLNPPSPVTAPRRGTGSATPSNSSRGRGGGASGGSGGGGNATAPQPGTTRGPLVTLPGNGGSTQTSAPPPAPPAPDAPSSVTATKASGTSVTVQWTPPAGAVPTGYNVTATPSLPTGTISVGAGQTSATVDGLTPGGVYTFHVQAINDTGASPATDSNEVSLGSQPTVTLTGVGVGGDGRTVIANASVDGGGLDTTCQLIVDGGQATSGPCDSISVGTGTWATDHTVQFQATNSMGSATATGSTRTGDKPLTADASSSFGNCDPSTNQYCGGDSGAYPTPAFTKGGYKVRVSAGTPVGGSCWTSGQNIVGTPGSGNPQSSTWIYIPGYQGWMNTLYFPNPGSVTAGLNHC